MSNIDKQLNKSSGVEDWSSVLVQAWKSDNDRLDEHYVKTDSDSTMFWDGKLCEGLGYKR